MKRFVQSERLRVGLVCFGILSGSIALLKYSQPSWGQRAIASSPGALQLATRVQTIFKQNCFKCHGQPGQKVRGGFDYVLDFEKLRLNPDYINLNDPIRSDLWKKIEADEMPFGKDTRKLSKEEKDAVLDWLKAGAPSVEGSSLSVSSDSGSTAAYSYILNAMVRDLKSIRAEKREDIRYLTLTHMPAAGDSAEDLELFRDALAKLVNSLSFQEDLFPLQAVDANRLIYRIDLRALGWKQELWEQMAQANPYALSANDNATQAINEQTKSSFPFVRGDWFSFVASKPPFYHQFLGLPDTDTALENTLIGLDADRDIRERRVLRAGFSDSGVSQNNRMIERHRSRFGAYWKSYDFKEGTGTSDLFSHPVGPGNGTAQFQHAGGEIIFNLPNGLQAYLLVNAAHKRLDEAPTQIVQDTSRRNATIINGISCISCHSVGMKPHSDQIRDYVEKNSTLFQSNDLEEVFATYQGNTKLSQAFTEDQNRFVNAMRDSGVRNLKGDVEPIRYLTDRFEKDVDIRRAAAELGVDLKTLEAKAAKDPELNALASRMTVRGMPRFVFVDVYQQMLGLLTAAAPGAEGGGGTNAVGMSFAPTIPPGTFQMGSPDGSNGTTAEAGRSGDERPHSVTISRGFEMQITDVTQLQWFKVMATKPSRFQGEGNCKSNFDRNRGICPNLPVEQVSWNDVQDFIAKLNRSENRTCGDTRTTEGFAQALRTSGCYRLPTEAEWEYAARAGTRTAYYFGDDASPGSVGKFAWFDGNSGGQTHDTGDRTHQPNRFGLYDMSGNVWQWVADNYETNYGLSSQELSSGVRDPRGPLAGPDRVVRGGSWNGNAQDLRSAQRVNFGPVFRNNFVVGFRLVRTR